MESDQVISANVAVYPLRAETSTAIHRSIDALEATEVDTLVGPMSTLVTGPVDAVFKALRDAYDAASSSGAVAMTVAVSNAARYPKTTMRPARTPLRCPPGQRTLDRGNVVAAHGPATETASIGATVQRLRAAFEGGRTRPAAWRKEQLLSIQRMLRRHEIEFLAALEADLGKPRIEGFATDVGAVTSAISYMLHNLDSWMRPDRARVPFKLRPARAEIMYEPLGVALVIAPWNHPIHLVLMPTAAALGAGNAVVAKPSSLAPACSALLADLVSEYLDPEAVAVVEGGRECATELLGQRFDHIFFTGSGEVGRIVMEAAAQHLTPVTLELGGMNPVIVDRSAQVEAAAWKIAWGKFLNAGQSCVAPDYVLVDRELEEAFLAAVATKVQEFYGADPRRSRDYARIVNQTHFRRLEPMLSEGEIVIGADSDETDRYIAPTVLRDVPAGSTVMAEEIFGPILPVLAVDSVEDAIEFVNKRPRPLALYVFTEERSIADRVLERTSSGGACVNTTVMHLSIPTLPFGGVGESGMGAYHGRYSFETFSHAKAVLRKPSRLDPGFAHPPYTRLKKWVIRRFL